MRVLILASLLAACAIPTQSDAQQPCGNRADIVAKLSDRYGESRVGSGLLNPTTLIEVFRSSETGSWTIIRTNQSGVSCIMAVGQSWEESSPAPKGEPT